MSWKPVWKNILYPTTCVVGLSKYLITQKMLGFPAFSYLC